jgi:hypothetical protein
LFAFLEKLDTASTDADQRYNLEKYIDSDTIR